MVVLPTTTALSRLFYYSSDSTVISIALSHHSLLLGPSKQLVYRDLSLVNSRRAVITLLARP